MLREIPRGKRNILKALLCIKLDILIVAVDVVDLSTLLVDKLSTGLSRQPGET